MIIINNEELLRVKCEDVTMDEVTELITILEKELDHANRLGVGGIGLAAPQIGLAKNIAIVRLKEHNFNLINARIEKGYDSAIFCSGDDNLSQLQRYISTSICPHPITSK